MFAKRFIRNIRKEEVAPDFPPHSRRILFPQEHTLIKDGDTLWLHDSTPNGESVDLLTSSKRKQMAN